jgi:hypothetical protein
MQEITLSRDYLAQGYDYSEQRAMLRSGELVRIRRGAYALSDAAPSEPRDVHRQLVEATVRQSSGEAVVSNLSAAVLHGLPVWDDQLSLVHVTRGRSGGGKRRRYVHLHPGRLMRDEVVQIRGMPVTGVARTVVDLGRTLSFPRSVPIADAALHTGLPPSDLQAAVDQAAGRQGVAAARRMCAFSDGRAESVGESTSRVVLHLAGFPKPELQYDIFDEDGGLVGRTDFCWPEHRTVGEFDGRVKYGRLLKPGQSPGEVMYREKLREDRLRDLGWQVVRWTWDELGQPQVIVRRLERAFVRGTRAI